MGIVVTDLYGGYEATDCLWTSDLPQKKQPILIGMIPEGNRRKNNAAESNSSVI